MNRNAPCSCGSGKRYKHCHGSVAHETQAPSLRTSGAQDIAAGAQTATGDLRREARAAHQAGELRRAEALYRSLVAARPDDTDARQLLATVLFERLHYREALDVLWDEAERTSWRNPIDRTNLGFALAKILSPQANARQQDLVARYLERERARKAEPSVGGQVSVVLIAVDDARMMERSIDSVAAQTYRDLELIIAGHASLEPVASKLKERLANLPFSATVITGAGASVTTAATGAARAANMGARRARGAHLAFLEAGDWFAADRIERMIAEIARPSPLWGFSQVEHARAVELDAEGGSPERRPSIDPARIWEFPADQFASFAFRRDDITGANANLFITRDLFLSLGGYREVDRHGWDFCVRAGRAVEPVLVESPLYFIGPPDRPQTDTGPDAQARHVLERRRKEIVVDALAGDSSVTNEFCPQYAGNRILLLQTELSAGRGDRIPIPVLRSLAAECRNSVVPHAPAVSRAHDASEGESVEKVALVVLGFYRSGTSALARVLNLCGAALPQHVIAARLDINRKGFWETEAVVDLNARMLQRVGARWDSIDIELPRTGAVFEEFLVTAREVLTREYGNEPLILIKDPRMCVLAPMWDRALRQSGYRPAYVVAVRHPDEVSGSLARSLERNGGMPVDRGLALWRSHMKATEAFVEATDAKVVFVHYDDLLVDWRRVVATIARQLDVPLDTDAAADAVDRFLEPSLRSQRTESGDSGVRTGAMHDATVDALYLRAHERCARARADEAGRHR